MTKQFYSIVIRLTGLTLAVLTTGCASRPPATVDPLGVTPQDFSIDLTVMTGQNVDVIQRTRLLCGRYVLDTDGSLKQGVAEAQWWGARWLPERTRTLDREQVAQVWSVVQPMGFVDSSHGNENINLYLVEPAPGEVTYLLATTANGQRQTFVRSSRIGWPSDPAMARLTQTLADLSWVSPTLQVQGYVVPPRYDFGPDPYARYRTEAGK